MLDTPLKALDLSQNTALVHVHLNKVPLTELTVGEKPGLSYLGCDSPDLASLDISGCPLLLAQDLTRKPEAYSADDTVRWLESSDLFISSKTTLTANGKTLYALESTAPTSLKLNKSGTVKMTLGKVLKLKTTIKPKDAVTKLKWKSSKPEYAKVGSSGIVTPVKAGGTTTITVTTANGKKATVKVKVVK